MIAINVLILAVGFVALIKGADMFVEGSSGLARNFRVPGLIIGLTIVALGTSAPELAVSTSAAFQGSNEIALSNVIGSNIFNLLCVLGFCALLHPVPVDTAILKRDFPLSIASTLLVLVVAGADALIGGFSSGLSMEENVGSINRVLGGSLLVIFLLYIAWLIFDARRHPAEEEDSKGYPLWKCALLIVVGIALVVGGGQAVVYSAKEIARAAGMTETLIGLTVVAAGTSLPELVTSIVAARKGETGLAIGNAIGSNLFNLMFILGVSSLIHPISVNLASAYDLVILIVVSAGTFVFAWSAKTISRREGVIMIAAYLADMAFAIVR